MKNMFFRLESCQNDMISHVSTLISVFQFQNVNAMIEERKKMPIMVIGVGLQKNHASY